MILSLWERSLMRLKDLVPTVGDTIGEHSLATGGCLYHLRVVLILSLWERSLMRLMDLVPTVGDTIGKHSLAAGGCL